ncbi:Panacea domain-containing protein [Pararoseomonas indoligenes]|uniref:SocA family protein n=1 Tax=Roseomonas indoligenes TaxID=2820811 RepID=A0A940S595_9PROT|nr:type II toxin-antitoxin system antitoxin SocA domain-containing protein [Pararoseomonas indoligenes]MBP0492779.1 SocA family protein [Pararoseomonas indoligenes]
MPYEAKALANWLLDEADRQQIPLTHMGVHKVIYYGHGWRLAQFNQPLIKEIFEAWEYGPVLAGLYKVLKAAGKDVVRIRAKSFDPVHQREVVPYVAPSEDDASFLRDVLRAYGRLNALTLSDMTHRPGGAWDQVWNAPKGEITLGMRIKNDNIRREFLNLDPLMSKRNRSDSTAHAS